MKPMIELSVVIPTLNEQAVLPATFASLAAQRAIALEIIIADGGSVDATLEIALAGVPAVTVVAGSAGRARQLNAGAAVAQGEFILFLHADSVFTDDGAFREAIDCLRQATAASDGRMRAGHFRLRFRRCSSVPSLAYYFYESKARLDRRGCAHGDQGILLPAELFRQSAGFDESCELLAETRFADHLRAQGRWQLLPQEISTSARRFEVEGMHERQTLNAVIMALAAAGRDDIVRSMPALYKEQAKTARLKLQPFFRLIADRLAALDAAERTASWGRIGGYICENIWQIAFFLDVLAVSGDRHADTTPRPRFLAAYDRYLHKAFNHRIAVRLATVASRNWLRYQLLKRG